ncbi:hypothetical protein V8C35DRAFT_301320 [Trichoderma chlorosporum]
MKSKSYPQDGYGRRLIPQAPALPATKDNISYEYTLCKKKRASTRMLRTRFLSNHTRPPAHLFCIIRKSPRAEHQEAAGRLLREMTKPFPKVHGLSIRSCFLFPPLFALGNSPRPLRNPPLRRPLFARNPTPSLHSSRPPDVVRVLLYSATLSKRCFHFGSFLFPVPVEKAVVSGEDLFFLLYFFSLFFFFCLQDKSSASLYLSVRSRFISAAGQHLKRQYTKWTLSRTGTSAQES